MINQSYLSPLFKYMIFHISTCILHHLRIYYELAKWRPSGWLDSSVGRAPHGIAKVMGSELVQTKFFFHALISHLLKLCVKLRWLILSSYSWNYSATNFISFSYHCQNSDYCIPSVRSDNKWLLHCLCYGFLSYKTLWFTEWWQIDKHNIPHVRFYSKHVRKCSSGLRKT